jgi:hypothetical protein
MSYEKETVTQLSDSIPPFKCLIGSLIMYFLEIESDDRIFCNPRICYGRDTHPSIVTKKYFCIDREDMHYI